MSEELWTTDAHELADWVRSGELKAVELLDTCLERIGRFDGELNSFAMLDPEGAHSQAEAVDQAVRSGEDPGPLAGLPIGVKDLEAVAGLPLGQGSLLFQDVSADHDSTQVARLKRAGAVVVGKTTTPELGSISFTWSKATGTTRNPWNPERTPGGSSGGSAAAVSAGLVPIATASDGGGSIRIPCSYTGLPGLKPTFGRVARGPGRLSSGNLSVYGPIARCTRDIARYLDQVSGVHPMDPFSLPKPEVPFEQSLDLSLSGNKVAWSSDLGFGVCDREVAEIARGAADRFLEATGAVESEIDVRLPDAGPSWAIAESIDCFTDLEEFWPGRSEEMTPVVAVLMQLAETLQPSQVAEAHRLRYEVLAKLTEVFQKVDLLLTPTTPTTAFEAEGPMPSEINGQPILSPLHAVCFTFPFNLSANPAATIPAGFTSDGMPVGLQIVGRRMEEATLLSAMHVMEQAHPWAKLSPRYS